MLIENSLEKANRRALLSVRLGSYPFAFYSELAPLVAVQVP